MASWLFSVTEILIPLYNLIGYMAIDATGVQVVKEPGRRPENKSFMWARGSPELGIVLFDYDPSGGGKIAKKLMEGYEGALQETRADARRNKSDSR